MAYTKQTWVDNNNAFPVSAARLNHMEDGIFAASNILVLEHNQTVPVDTPAGTIVIKKDF